MYRKQVDEFVIKHWKEGAIEGPCKLGTEVIQTSPLGAFIKKGKQKICVIHDLSYPHERSVNAGITKEMASVNYSSVLDAVELCKQYNTPYMAKYDLQDGFFKLPSTYGR